jgi:hypothetical protein
MPLKLKPHSPRMRIYYRDWDLGRSRTEKGTLVTPENLQRWAVPGALLMGAAWFASGIVAFVVPGGVGPGVPGELRFFLIEGLHAVGELGMLAALVGLHVPQAPRYGWLGRVGFRVAFAGTAAILLVTLFAAAGGEGNLLTGILFAIGMLGWLVGFPLLGIATLRASVLPSWISWLLIAFVPLLILRVILVFAFAFQAYGVLGVAVGLLWLLLAYGLWSHRSTPVHRERT